MKPSARIISGTIEGVLLLEDDKQIEVKHYVVGTLNMQMGFVISVIDRYGKIRYMLSNSGETMQMSEETDIGSLHGIKIEGVVSNGGWRRFRGVILGGTGGIYIEISGHKKKVFHNPGLTKIIMISETLERYQKEFKKG